MGRVSPALAVLASLAIALAGCGGGGSSPAPVTTPAQAPVYAQPSAQSLSVADVEQVVAQAVAEARARGTPAVISVSDRVGNVLAVYQMVGAPSTLVLRPGPGAPLDIQGISLPGVLGPPAALGAIAKAITGAYLSSSGNAFSTRTASEIVQDTFPPSPATVGLGSGPLFGVQFSQLPCSDLEVPPLAAGQTIGPKPSPLGLSADPGGFPLYKGGVLVGGVGVKSTSDYGFDPNVTVDNPSQINEEAIALAGAAGFTPPPGITADAITVGGNSLIYSVATPATLKSSPASAPAFSTLPLSVGALVGVSLFHPVAAIQPGQAYGTETSGVRKSTSAEFNNADAYVLTDGTGNARFSPRAGTDSPVGATALTAAEVQSVLQNAFGVMSQARAQIRNPLNSRAQVTISVVDTNGVALGIVRAPDAPMFGIDVSLQKARTASFFSSAAAASDLTGNADPGAAFLAVNRKADIQAFVVALRTFLGDSSALTGKTAYSVRAIGGLSRPLFPDGQVGGADGPLSRPSAQWSVFATGLQTALIDTNLVHALSGAPDSRCAFLPAGSSGQNRLQNGLQIFSGGVPIYRGGVLVGAVGVSGDGTSQDDMIGFLGVDGAGAAVGSIANAPAAIRADQLAINQGGGVNRLRYVSCPAAPFLNSSVQDPCTGK